MHRTRDPNILLFHSNPQKQTSSRANQISQDFCVDPRQSGGVQAAIEQCLATKSIRNCSHKGKGVVTFPFRCPLQKPLLDLNLCHIESRRQLAQSLNAISRRSWLVYWSGYACPRWPRLLAISEWIDITGRCCCHVESRWRGENFLSHQNCDHIESVSARQKWS